MQLIISLVVVVLSYPWLAPVILDIADLVTNLSHRTPSQRLPRPRPKKSVPIRANALEISNSAVYVALGSSFAAGPGVGETVLNSVGRAQGTQSYPCQLAAKLGLNASRFVNAASSGELLANIANTSLKYISPATKLVTITAGGNDVGYTRDFTVSAARPRWRSALMRAIEQWLHPLPSALARDFGAVERRFDELCTQIRAASPHAVIVLVSYITVIPAHRRLPPLSDRDCTVLREVAEQLRATTEAAARRNQCVFVDLAHHSQHNDALATAPWSTGFDGLVPVHPNLAGHTAAADLIYSELASCGFLKEF